MRRVNIATWRWSASIRRAIIPFPAFEAVWRMAFPNGTQGIEQWALEALTETREWKELERVIKELTDCVQAALRKGGGA